MYTVFIYPDSSLIISHCFLIRVSDFTAVELFDALANSQGDPVDFLSYENRRIAKLCELNCLTRDLDVDNVGAVLVSSGTHWVQFKSRILSLTWPVFKQIPGAIDKQRIAAEAQRKAIEEAAEAQRKAVEETAEEQRKVAEAQRKAAEETAEAQRKVAEAQRKAAEETAEAQRKVAEAQRKAVEEAAEAQRKAAEAAEADRKAQRKAAEAADAQRLKNALLEHEILSDKALAVKLELAALREKLEKRNAAKSQSPKRTAKGFNKSKK
jgi:flagellar biosynthesis GTPase FlhF